MPRTLYICYFGVREPLVQTQVIAYLREIQKGGTDVSLLTFEPARDSDAADWDRPIREQLRSQGIDWHWLRYHKRFSVLATAYDVFRGVMFVRSFIAKHRPEVLHGRIHVPTLMAALARKFSAHKPKLLFDIRGFFPEEYTDAGVWPANGWLYRMVKRVERWLLKESDGFVVLTNKARDILFPESRETGHDKFGRPVEVIPCCVDFEKFKDAGEESRQSVRTELNVGDRTVITYVGSFGGWYLTDEMLDLFSAAREHDPNTFALILTQRNHERIEERLRERGFAESDYYVRGVPPGEIPRYLSGADVAISFIKACYSKLSSSPTKIAEYLACGLPIISNRGVGDIDELLERTRTGSLINGFAREDYLESLAGLSLSPELSERCRTTARNEFELSDVGGVRYRRIYSELLKGSESETK